MSLALQYQMEVLWSLWGICSETCAAVPRSGWGKARVSPSEPRQQTEPRESHVTEPMHLPTRQDTSDSTSQPTWQVQCINQRALRDDTVWLLFVLQRRSPTGKRFPASSQSRSLRPV